MNFEYGEWKSEFKHRHNRASHNQQNAPNDGSLHSSPNHPETNVPLTGTNFRTKKKPPHTTIAPRPQVYHPPTSRAAKWFMGVVGVIAAFSFINILSHQASPEQRKKRRDKQAIVKWRRTVQSRCQRFLGTLSKGGDDWSSPTTQQKKEQVDQWALQQFQFGQGDLMMSDPLPPSMNLPEETSCKYAFIELNQSGNEKGDALGAWVELALDVCTPIWHYQQPDLPWQQSDMSRPRLDVETLLLSTTNNNAADDQSAVSYLPEATSIRRFLHSWLWRTDRKEKRKNKLPPPRLPSPVFPEDMCILGIEDSGVGTAKLQAMANFVAGIQPPIFRTFHTVSETIPVNAEGESQSEKMDGETISSPPVLVGLLRQIMSPLLPTAAKQRGPGGFLMLHVDRNISHGRVLQEVATIQILCDLGRLGTKVVILFESTLDGEKSGPEEQTTPAALEECGVVFVNLKEF